MTSLVAQTVPIIRNSLLQLALLQYLPFQNRILQHFRVKLAQAFLYGDESFESLSDYCRQSKPFKSIRVDSLQAEFWELCSILRILAIAIDEPNLERLELEQITEALREFSMSIVDTKAAFMARSEAKDLIQRIIFRLGLIISRRGVVQKHLDDHIKRVDKLE